MSTGSSNSSTENCSALCIICWERFNSTDNIKAGACGHVFHSDCLEKWWKSSNSCPICRKAAPTFFKIYLDFEETTIPGSATAVDKEMDPQLTTSNLMKEYENLLYETALYRDEVDYLSHRVTYLMSRNAELEDLHNLNSIATIE